MQDSRVVVLGGVRMFDIESISVTDGVSHSSREIERA